MKPSLLMIDDGGGAADMTAALMTAGFQVETAPSPEEGHSLFDRLQPDIVLLDAGTSGRDGLVFMRDCLEVKPSTRFVVVTCEGSANRAVEAMRAGAYEYLVRPVGHDRLIETVQAAAQAKQADDPDPAQPATRSAAMTAVLAKIDAVSRSMATVFISGESGTGKEFIAREIHARSRRRAGPFVPLYCGALEGAAIERELFAAKPVDPEAGMAPGALVRADGGTLFLDEICESDLALQSRLMRFLQTSSVPSAGPDGDQSVSVRLICSTSRDPLAEMRAGRLREDLYYRLHVVPIHLPPLRARGGEILTIARDELARLSQQEGKGFDSLAEPVQELFLRHPWPGNVRQLRNVLHHAVVLHHGPQVALSMLPEDVFRDEAADEGKAVPGIGDLVGRTLAEIEQTVIDETIRRCGGSIPRAAKILDVAPSTLYRKRGIRQAR